MKRAAALLAAAAAVLIAAPASAQIGSGAPIRIVVTGPAGGTPDIIARTAAERMSAVLGEPVVVDNRTGGLGAVSHVQGVAKAEPNGRTLLIANTSLFSIAPTMYKKPPYDPVQDFVPISLFATSPNIMAVNAQTPATTYRELVDLLAANPGKFNFASGGVGTPMHLYGELIKAQANLTFAHIPYRGSAPAIVDLLSNQVQFMFDQIPSMLPHIQAGKLRALVVANPVRTPLLPEVPTLTEVGLQGADAISWFGLVAPHGTPPAVIERLSAAARAAMQDPAAAARLKTLGADAVGSTPDEMTAHVARQLAAWRPLVIASGVTAE